MDIRFFCPRWGSDHLSWELFCKRIKEDGYDGFEYGIGREIPEKDLDSVWNLAEKYQLKIIPQHYDTYEADFSGHYDLYADWLQKIKIYPAEKINSQTGKDFFSFDQNKSLVELAAATGVEVVHETHRNKFLFAAHTSKNYLDRIPGLKITLDASHWVCVAESYLQDQPEAMDLAIAKTEHIHARVGYPEGPQVTDPRLDEWKEALYYHLSWWDQVVEKKKKEKGNLTITPEFGPYPYMVKVPGTGDPVSDQWEVNLFMMRMLRERYGK